MAKLLRILDWNSIPKFIFSMEDKGFSLLPKREVGELRKKLKLKNPEKMNVRVLGFKFVNQPKKILTHIFVFIPFGKEEVLFLSSYFTKTKPWIPIQGHQVFRGEDAFSEMLKHIDIALERAQSGRISETSRKVLEESKKIARKRQKDAHRRRVRPDFYPRMQLG